jgi:outer membrane biosynthesis protein TonB
LSCGSDIVWGEIPVYIEFNLDQFDGPRGLAWNFVNASGWLQVVETTMDTPIGKQSRTYIIGCNDEGVTLPEWEADFLLGLPPSHPMPTQHFVPSELSAIAEMARYDFMGECDGLALEALEALEDATRSDLRHLELRFNQVLKLAANHLAALQSELRSFTLAVDRRLWVKAQIERLENEETRAGGVFVEERQRIRQAAEARETALIESLTYEADVEVLYTVQFEARMRGREKQIAWPLIEEEPFSPGLSQERAQQAMKEYFGEAADRRKIRAANSARQKENDAKWLASAKRKKAEVAEQSPAVTKRKPNRTPKKVIKLKQESQPKVAPKPAEKPVIQKPLTDAEEHTALRAEVASLSDILRHSGRSTFETKQGLWRVTRRKQPQGDELQAIYHAIGQTNGATEAFPRILRFLAPAPKERAQQALKDHLEDEANHRTEDVKQRAQDVVNEAERLSVAKRKQSEVADKPTPTQMPKKVPPPKAKPAHQVKPKPDVQKSITEAGEHATLRTEVTDLKTLLRLRGHDTVSFPHKTVPLHWS